MRPRSPVFDLLALSGEWEPLRSLAQDSGVSYASARHSIGRWKRAGLVESRLVELGNGKKGIAVKIEVRILEANP